MTASGKNSILTQHLSMCSFSFMFSALSCIFYELFAAQFGENSRFVCFSFSMFNVKRSELTKGVLEMTLTLNFKTNLRPF